MKISKAELRVGQVGSFFYSLYLGLVSFLCIDLMFPGISLVFVAITSVANAFIYNLNYYLTLTTEKRKDEDPNHNKAYKHNLASTLFALGTGCAIILYGFAVFCSYFAVLAFLPLGLHWAIPITFFRDAGLFYAGLNLISSLLFTISYSYSKWMALRGRPKDAPRDHFEQNLKYIDKIITIPFKYISIAFKMLITMIIYAILMAKFPIYIGIMFALTQAVIGYISFIVPMQLKNESSDSKPKESQEPQEPKSIIDRILINETLVKLICYTALVIDTLYSLMSMYTKPRVYAKQLQIVLPQIIFTFAGAAFALLSKLSDWIYNKTQINELVEKSRKLKAAQDLPKDDSTKKLLGTSALAPLAKETNHIATAAAFEKQAAQRAYNNCQGGGKPAPDAGAPDAGDGAALAVTPATQ